jgi:transposase
VVVGVVFDEQGFEMAHRTFAGNQSDSKSLVEMVAALQAAAGYAPGPELLPGPGVMVIVDAGVATAKNLKLLAQAKFHYLVNDTRRGRQKWRAEFAQEEQFERLGGRENKSEVKVRAVAVEGGQRVVLCKSQGRREKELAMRSRAEEKFLAALGKLKSRMEKGQLKDEVKAQRALGRVLERFPRVGRFYQVGLKAGAGLSWQRKDAAYGQDEELLGCYVLRSDRSDLSAARLWELYVLLARAEDGFRALKGDLGLRPNFHQLEPRVDGHIFITVMAYQLLRFITYTLEQKGDVRDWPTVRRVLETHGYATVTVPTRSGTVVHLRRPGQPESCQAEIYAKFGMDWKKLPTKKITTAVKRPSTL